MNTKVTTNTTHYRPSILADDNAIIYTYYCISTTDLYVFIE